MKRKLSNIFCFVGERIAIQGLAPDQVKPGSTVQLQVKGGGTQTLQLLGGTQSLQGLTVDPSKLTVLQELPGMQIAFFLIRFLEKIVLYDDKSLLMNHQNSF